MTKRRFLANVFSVGLFIASTSGASFAHHSQAGFDVEKSVTIEGTITQLLWQNPHPLLYLDGKLTGDTEVKSWTIEAPSLSVLEKSGWTKDSIKVGDKISVTANPSRTGRPFVLLQGVTTASGQKLSAGRPNGGSNVDYGKPTN